MRNFSAENIGKMLIGTNGKNLMKKAFIIYITLILFTFTVFAQEIKSNRAGKRRTISGVSKKKLSVQKRIRNRKFKFLSKPIPNFTDEARKRYTQGIVELKITFNENGKVGIIEVIKGLPSGLTENAIKAAKQIKFKPAIKKRKLVKTTITIEYIFDFF